MYSGNMVWSNIATFLVIAVVIVCTLMPIWPATAKHILWYCSVTFLIVIFSLLLLRGTAFVLMWLLGYEFWVFPRLFDESLSFQDSFVPIYTFEKGTPGQGYFRLGALALLGGFVYWACTQPTEFDGLLKAQKDFIDDLYSGNLLADVAHAPTAHMDRSKRVPSLEDLLKAMEADEKEKIGDTDGGEYVSETVEMEMGASGTWVKVGEEDFADSTNEANESDNDQQENEGSSDDLASNSNSSKDHGEEEEEWTAPDYEEGEDGDVEDLEN